MGCWGMGLTQSDEFCEVYDRFMDEYNEGEEVEKITAKILAEYHDEFDDNDGIMHDVYFALAKAEWMCCVQSKLILNRVDQIIRSGENLDFYRELEATKSDIKIREKHLIKFWESLQTPRNTARKRRPAPKYDFADMEKGEVFWYRSKGAIYGALVLEKLSPKHYLVVLSNALSKTPKTTDEVLNTSTYTAVWFSALLPTKRIHRIGKVLVEGAYSGRAGLYLSENVEYCENNGYDRHWEHSRCSLEFPDMKVKDLLIVENVPASFKYPEALKRSQEWESRYHGGRGLIVIK